MPTEQEIRKFAEKLYAKLIKNFNKKTPRLLCYQMIQQHFLSVQE
jgi:hypothetical protein